MPARACVGRDRRRPSGVRGEPARDHLGAPQASRYACLSTRRHSRHGIHAGIQRRHSRAGIPTLSLHRHVTRFCVFARPRPCSGSPGRARSPSGAWIRLDDATPDRRRRAPRRSPRRPSRPSLTMRSRPPARSSCTSPSPSAALLRAPAATSTRGPTATSPRSKRWWRASPMRGRRASPPSPSAAASRSPAADLGLLAEEARRLGLVPVMTTSGIGLTAERVAGLRAFAQNQRQPRRRGRRLRGGARLRRRGARRAGHRPPAAAGIPVGVNVVLTRASFPWLADTGRPRRRPRRRRDPAPPLQARRARRRRCLPGGRPRASPRPTWGTPESVLRPTRIAASRPSRSAPSGRRSRRSSPRSACGSASTARWCR